MEHASGFGMNPSTVLLVVVTQLFVTACNLVALLITRRMVRQIPSVKRWRHLAILAWLKVALLLAVLQVAIIVIGCPPLPVMRLLLWLDRTSLVVGFIAIIATAWQLWKFTLKVDNE